VRPGSADGTAREAPAAPAWWSLGACAAALAWPWAPLLVWPSAAIALWRRRRGGGLAWLLAVLWAGLAGWTLVQVVAARGLARPEAVAREILADYTDTLRDLEERAAALAAELGSGEADRAERMELFRRLERARRQRGAPPGVTSLLVDRDGVAVAWSGDGLRHDLPEAELSTDGLHSESSFAAVTLYAVAPLDPSRRPARAVVGRSFATTELPFGPPPDARREDGTPEWTVVADAAADGGIRKGDPFWELAPEGGPALRVRAEVLERDTGLDRLRSAPARAWLWLALGVALACAACWRHALRPARRALVEDALLPLGAAILLVLYGVGASWGTLVVTATGILLSGAAARRPPLALSTATRIAAGAGLAVLLLALAWTVQRVEGPVALGAFVWQPLEGWALRLGSLALATAACWTLVAGSAPERLQSKALGALGFLATALAGALVERPLVAGLLLALGGGALAAALASLRRAPRLLATALAGAAMSAAAWTIAERAVLRESLRSELDVVLEAARSEAATGELGARVTDHLARTDLEDLALGPVGRLDEAQDLALALWLASPLARHPAPSALLVLLDDGASSSFSYGLPLDESVGELATDPRRWPVSEAAAQWAENALSGTVELVDGAATRGEARFWYLPLRRPAGEPTARADATTLTRDLLGGYQDGLAWADPRSGIRVEVGSSVGWRGVSAPALRVQHVDRRGFTAFGLRGERFWIAGPSPLLPRSDFLVRLRAPALGPLEALRRTCVHATASLLALLALLSVALLIALGRPALRRQLGRWLSSYSRKLVLVSTVLVVLPLALLNVLLLRAFERRLEAEQRANGEDALRSAERILSDYLPTLEPGFSIETELDDALLGWLAQVVSHEVNLYWRGYVYASSKRELFTAGILPRRIPGEVFSELAPGADATVARTNRVSPELSYLELYRSIRLPGEGSSPGAARLLLSVPLLAQQEEVTKILSVFQQQALVVTAALLSILIAVSSRLAASFTTPLTQIVRGTARIAEGARSLGLRPSEPELSALVEAIDDMALRIADARERLVREKQVVDSVVAHITSGVVSIGRDGRIQMSNRKAVELLGCRVGDRLPDCAREQPVEALRRLLESPPERLDQRTARFAGGDGEEREWTIVWVPVPGEGDPAALLVVEDVTEVLRGQRLEAWAQMARIIAHEIKNPLTPIRLSAEHLLQVWQQAPERVDEVMERCIANILDQVGELRDTAAEFSTYSQIPSAEPSLGDLVEAVRDVVDAYAMAPTQGVAVRLHAATETLPLRFDRRLVVRAVRNLVENAMHASRDGGGTIDVRVRAEDGAALIEVEDQGPGVPEPLLPRIFEPSFSTHVGGTGLGLPITLRIAEQHGGTVTAANLQRGGLRVTIRLPLREVVAP
jgi:signal transduction histidine kinase